MSALDRSRRLRAPEPAGPRDGSAPATAGTDLRHRAARWLFIIGVALILIGSVLARWEVRAGLGGAMPPRGGASPAVRDRITAWPSSLSHPYG